MISVSVLPCRWGQLASALAVGVLLFSGSSFGQGTQEDYDRADGLRDRFRNRVFRAEVTPHWIGEGSRGWYRVQTAEKEFEFVLFDAGKGWRKRAFDHDAMAQALSELLGFSVKSGNLPLSALRFGADSRLIGFQAKGRIFEVDSSALGWKQIGESSKDPAERQSSRSRASSFPKPNSESPDQQWRVEIRDRNVWLVSKADGEEYPLSFEGNEEDGYVDEVYWAPNSSRFAAIRRQSAQNRQVRLVESSPRDRLQPRLHALDYLKPGDRIAVSKPHLFEVVSKSEIPISDAWFPNPWRIRNYRWASDSKELYFLYNQRGHQTLRIVGVDGFTGAARAVVNETSPTFIDYAYKQFSRHLEDSEEVIWMSERDGWNHLYLFDRATGQLKNQITQGEWVVRKVDFVDEKQRVLWFQAGGIYPEQDPYYLHACRIRLDGSGLVVLTEGNGTHTVRYSPNRRYLTATWSRVDQAPITELRDGRDGSLIAVLERADASALQDVGWRAPEPFAAKGRDGKTDIYGVIFRPSNFREDQRYPVVEHIYAGPHGSHAPKSFRAFRSAQAMAELGFVVVRIDGMGTSNRSKAFHDVCWQNLKDAGFPDRILWMQTAAKRYPHMDVSRVGIYGGSAGGQNTVSALLHHGDFYKAGAADCGCHDNRMDKIWWNELWMGWPIGPQYAENSNVTHAGKLSGKLLLTVGELDRNVDPASTLQLADALIQAGKDFEFLLVPGAGHGVGDSSPYLIRKRRDFFVRHLHGVQPRRGKAKTGNDVAAVPPALRNNWKLDAFYQKWLDNDGFPILSSEKVSDYALLEADYLIDQMLKERDDVRKALIDLRFRFSIMAANEFTTDVPEHADLIPKNFWDRRARGLGATPTRPSVSCGEENLLQFPGDPYQGENILIHEFAHAMHEAIRVIEPDFDERLKALFQKATAAGLWKGKYASTNRYEYWAECVQSYFDDNRENDASHNHVNTRTELEAYDPGIFALIQETFRNNPWRYTPPKERETAMHLVGYDFSQAAAFVWPERLAKALPRGETDSGERRNEIVPHNIEGWTIWVDIQLLEGFDEALGKKALSLLQHQLFGVKLLMPEDRIEKLQQIAIRLDRDNKTLRGIQYHPSRQWLLDNGHDPRAAKMVHIPQARHFVSRSLSATQPRVVLHELAHAYHDQFLGFDHQGIRQAFRQARTGGKYESVQHVKGHFTRHYALSDFKEYFAEGTEAYFGANDFYPFVRAELQEHDPTLFQILQKIWGKL